MSGLEIAGAVLGSIPLVISAIEHYANGISTARRYLKYQTEMEDLLRKIRTEQKLFKNTIETLLNGIASDERMSDIVAGGNFWQEPDIELKLKDRLRDAYDIYLDNVCGMEASLQRFREKLALDQAGKMTEPTQIALKSPKQVRFVQPRNECSSSDITLVERSSAPIIKSMPIQIGDLCTAIAALPTPQPIACIGYLTDNSNRQYGIYPLDSANDSEKSSPTVYSLRQILTEYKSNNWRLRLSDKLQVALDLAFSVLQLYKTPWLDEQWSDSDVYFVRHPDAPAASLYEHPFVYRKISASKIDQASDNIGRPAAYRVIRNQTLFTLGILLIELCFEKSIEDLQLPCDLDCSNTPGVAWCTAQRLLDEKKLEFKIGPGYQDIVRRCIWCDFDQGKSNLDDRDLQRAVFEKVVVPLEEILQVLG
ncbi:uncharacterized protein J4E84_004356 [Alternaria hordeiaustralica]|uniref:uncharacterized protein n=1 Tax=Alternaria hordeiaustralica TaxID=1187925 RepID=UPI0020C59E8C|nr:uncharacterized protein J4E84_004356 [Alternaria hordeiaustralica]KAI4690174.1 hypothetical protein J4E84_004356 [Alternaria hordeiaustralica]